VISACTRESDAQAAAMGFVTDHLYGILAVKSHGESVGLRPA
jgi:hypothetical protein